MPGRLRKTTEYLVYPLLEAVLKRELSEFFYPSGRVAKPFPGLWPNGNPRRYKVDQHCSDVANILRLYMTQPEFAELSCDLQKILDHIESIYPDTNAFDVISTDWRNPAIHSANPVNTAPGVVLNIIILLALSHIDNSQWDARYDANGGSAIT